MRRHVRESSPEAAANTLPAESAEEWAVLEPQLDEAMLTLPARQRDLVVRCHFENQPQRAAARSLGISAAKRDLAAWEAFLETAPEASVPSMGKGACGGGFTSARTGCSRG